MSRLVSSYFCTKDCDILERLPSLSSLTLPVADRKGEALRWERMPFQAGWEEPARWPVLAPPPIYRRRNQGPREVLGSTHRASQGQP